jgi:antitoxin component of RelBE/YafQ-DinJ toxin-antitoxin module
MVFFPSRVHLSIRKEVILVSKIDEVNGATATINVRLPEHLKKSGDKVLARKGVSISELVRELYQCLVEKQDLPELRSSPSANREVERIAKKHELLNSLVGILPPDLDFDTARNERLQRHLQAGVIE